MEGFVYKKHVRNNSLRIVSECIDSGLQVAEWCRQHSVPKNTYYYHHAKLRREGRLPGRKGAVSKSDGLEQVVFCEIPLFPSEGDCPPGTSCGGDEPVRSGPDPAIVVEYGKFRLSINQSAGKDLILHVMEAVAHV